jgi:hypothetical protein
LVQGEQLPQLGRQGSLHLRPQQPLLVLPLGPVAPAGEGVRRRPRPARAVGRAGAPGVRVQHHHGPHPARHQNLPRVIRQGSASACRGSCPRRCEQGTRRGAPLSGVEASNIQIVLQTQEPRASERAALSACSRTRSSSPRPPGGAGTPPARPGQAGGTAGVRAAHESVRAAQPQRPDTGATARGEAGARS